MSNSLDTDRDKFIENNLNLVHSILRKDLKMSQTSPEYEDLFQVGVMGLIEAYDRFDVDKGFKFSTYAYPMIKFTILRYKRDSTYQIHYSRTLKDKKYKVLFMSDYKSQKEIMKDLKLSLYEFNAIQDMLTGLKSLDYDVSSASAANSNNETTLGELINSPSSSDIPDLISILTIEEYLSELLWDLYAGTIEGIKIDDKSKTVYKDIYEEYIYSCIYEDRPTQEYLANKYHISQVQVSRILHKMNNHMRKIMEN